MATPTEADATTAFDEGCKSIKANDMELAIEKLARALEIRSALYGEQDIKTASAYYKYGCALFYKAQDENTVFGKQAQAAADAKDGKASNEGDADDDGEACDDDDDGDDEKPEKDGESDKDDEKDEEDEEEEEDDMELAWKLIENARLIYEEDGDYPVELANVYETLGEINTEHANFDAALEDLAKCLAILEMELEEDDRRIAGVLCSMSVAHQLLDEPEKALKGVERAIGICASRVNRLKSSDEAAIAAVGKDHDDPMAAAKAELEQLEAVMADLRAREEELRGLVSEDASTREQIKKAFAAIGGMAGGAAGAAGAAGGGGGVAGGEPEETAGFAKPRLATNSAAPVNLGVVGKSAGASRVTLAPSAPAPDSAAAAAAAAFAAMPPAKPPAPSAPRRSLEDVVGGGGGGGETTEGFGDAPAAKKAKPATAADATAAPVVAGEKENTPDTCKQQ
jgi:HAT1-interacting factor 1